MPLLLTPPSSPGPINCFDSQDDYKSFWNGTLVDSPVNKYGFVDGNFFDSQIDVMEERWKALGGVCLKHESGQFLPYVGTTATVRDLVAIAEHFDGKGCDINYYGLGYGTMIGNYLINSESTVPSVYSPDSQPTTSAFPNRVGRIILDGMQDPSTYTSVPSHLSWGHLIRPTDEAFKGFAYGCALAGPYGCPLAARTFTGPEIIREIKKLFEVCTPPVGHPTRPHHHE